MAEAVGRTFPYLWWLIALGITGLFFIILVGPFFILFFDSEFFSYIQADGPEALITFFPMAWRYIYQNLPWYILLIVSFAIGLAGSTITTGGLKFFARRSKVFGPLSRYIKSAWLDLQAYGDPKFIKFRVWLTKHPPEKANWDWEYFIYLMTFGVVLTLSLCTGLYTVFSIMLFINFRNAITDIPFIKGLSILFGLWLITIMSFQSFQHHKNIFSSTQQYLFKLLEDEE